MKHLLMAVGLASYGLAFAQTDQANLEKYWKFRNSFRERFVKIGPLAGESLPAGALKPKACVDNIAYSGNGFGEMHWGDGMIRHGHYLGLLATEYALLKRGGQDVTGTLNELYYALNTINRLDIKAEPNQGGFYGLVLNDNLNGFFLREDVPEDFASDHWGNDPLGARCTNSAFYRNNNAAKQNDSGNGWYNLGNGYQNVPSLDQMTSLMIGLSLVHKLVDDIYVKPKPSDAGFNVVTEAKHIVSRMMNYVATRNWFIIDVNGWPVANGGGDLCFAAYPLGVAANRITGNSYNNFIQRKKKVYTNVQHCVTGFGSDDSKTQQEKCDDLNIIERNLRDFFIDNYSWIAGPDNNQDNSRFQDWQFDYKIGDLSVLANATEGIWTGLLPNVAPQFFTNFSNIYYLNEYNRTIMFNLGVVSGLWNNVQAFSWGNYTENRQLELINAILRDEAPISPKFFYQGYLNSMPKEGPYNLLGQNYPFTHTDSLFQSNGWAAEYRWTNPSASIGVGGEKGIYSGLDYMLYHNLYMLIFQPAVEYAPVTTCFCGSAVNKPASSIISGHVAANASLNSKLALIETCVQDAFAPVAQTINGIYNIEPKFSDYADLQILTMDYQTNDASITSNGQLKVRNNFVVCNMKTLTLQNGGKMEVEKGETFINVGARINASGEIRIKSGTQLRIGNQGQLTLNANSKIIVEDNARLIIDFGGILEYYSGAQIITQGENNEIIMRGTVKIMNTATFKIDHSADGHSGRFLMAGGTFLAMQPNTKIDLKGKGITDEFVVLPDNGKIWVQSQNISSFRIDKCKVRLGENAYIKAEQPFYSTEVDYYAVKDNLGITVTDLNQFNYCNFTDVFVDARLNIEQVSKFNAYRCNFTRNDFALINYIPTLRVEGMGFVLNHCTFTNGLPRSIEAKNMTVPSGIYNSVFEQQYGVLPLIFHGISDESNTEIVIQNSTFTGFGTAIVKSSGKLSLRCNTFISNSRTNVEVKNGCMLNISTADYAGYNYFHTTGDQSIKLTFGNINLNNGYNYISENSPKAIQGSLSYACTNCVIAARKNQWNAGNTTPGPNKFSLLSSNGNVIGMSYPAPAVVPACGYEDQGPVPGDPGGGVAGKAGGAPGELPMVYIFGDSLPLDQAIAYGRNKMEIHDSLGNDLEAITVFDGIFSSDILKSDSIAGPLLRHALTSMKTAVENAISNGKISKADNAGGFEQHVAMYVQALMYLTDSVITSDNYVSQYYHELDKAHLFRVIGHADIGLDLLTALEDCGLDSAQQAQLNYWKTEYAKDLVVEQIGLETLDTLIAIDTLGYTQPQSLQFNKYHFGAKINSLFDIVYPNCDFYSLRTARTENGPAIILFPNPAAEVVYIQFNHPSESGISLLTFQGADGRQVFGATFTGTGQSRQSVDVSEWKPGMYLYKYVSPSGKAFTGKLVVE